MNPYKNPIAVLISLLCAQDLTGSPLFVVVRVDRGAGVKIIHVYPQRNGLKDSMMDSSEKSKTQKRVDNRIRKLWSIGTLNCFLYCD